MKKYKLSELSSSGLEKLLARPAIDPSAAFKKVRPILNAVKAGGDKEVKRFAARYDGLKAGGLLVSEKEFMEAEKLVPREIKRAIKIAASNIEKFHRLQIPESYSLNTMPGVECSRKFRPIENVGLYIPGGSAVLVSTILMLAIPARLAGCPRIVLCSPSKNGRLAPEVLFAARYCGVTEFYKVGGAHAIAMMAYGTESVRKVDKIFGPGNQYVTAAKSLVSIDTDGALIDMPAGPSELMIIADKSANPEFIAADFLSQVEHGPDSQSILITYSDELADVVEKEIRNQLRTLARKKIVSEALKSSFILVVPDLKTAFNLSNKYAPEHLILNFRGAEKQLSKVKNAGSVFIGNYSPESAGDYASGTNHSLPTYGYAKSSGGVSVEAFMKQITFQKLSKRGLAGLSDTIIKLAETEKLDAHARAVKIRFENGN